MPELAPPPPPNPTPTPAALIRIKGRSFIALVLMPAPPVEDWLAALDAQAARSPAFFDQRPVIVDLSALAHEQASLEPLVAALERRGLRIIGIEGAPAGWTDSETWGRPPIASNGRADRFMEILDETPAEPPPPPPPNTMIHDGPVRSGQSVFFEHGDVTVLGSVASGAEVIAGGSVHVYGALRGRVIAGFSGRADARVYCTRMDAELVAIDGVYKLAEDVPAALRGQPVQAALVGDSIVMTLLQ